MNDPSPNSDDDRRLRERFAELARDDARRVPDFARMWARTAPRLRSGRVAVVTSGMLAAAAALVVWCGTTRLSSPAATTPVAAASGAAPLGGEAAEPIALEGPLDPAPLDFLLDVAPAAQRGAALSGLDSTSVGQSPIQGW